MITGTTRFDISREDRQRDNDALTALYGTPEGTRVILFVGRREFVDSRLVDWIRRDYADRLHIDVQGEPEAVRRWVCALRGQKVTWGERWSA